MAQLAAPEFGFERDVDNVRRAVRDMRIGYPTDDHPERLTAWTSTTRATER
jgi:hypothetical protein